MNDAAALSRSNLPPSRLAASDRSGTSDAPSDVVGRDLRTSMKAAGVGYSAGIVAASASADVEVIPQMLPDADRFDEEENGGGGRVGGGAEEKEKEEEEEDLEAARRTTTAVAAAVAATAPSSGEDGDGKLGKGAATRGGGDGSIARAKGRWAKNRGANSAATTPGAVAVAAAADEDEDENGPEESTDIARTKGRWAKNRGASAATKPGAVAVAADEDEDEDEDGPEEESTEGVKRRWRDRRVVLKSRPEEESKGGVEDAKPPGKEKKGGGRDVKKASVEVQDFVSEPPVAALAVGGFGSSSSDKEGQKGKGQGRAGGEATTSLVDEDLPADDGTQGPGAVSVAGPFVDDDVDIADINGADADLEGGGANSGRSAGGPMVTATLVDEEADRERLRQELMEADAIGNIGGEVVEATMVPKQSFLRRSRVCLAIFLLVVIGLAVGLTVFFVQRPQAVPIESLSASPTLSMPPTDMPTLSPTTANLQTFTTFLVSNNISQQATLDDRSSPQYRASEWIADEDVHEDESAGGRIVERRLGERALQRYLLALLFFSTGGDDDPEDSEWEQSLLFLSDGHECDWEGVDCFVAGVDRYVNGIKLDVNGLSGQLIDEICLLRLTKLSLAGNELAGTIPDCLGSRRRSRVNLTELSLAGNGFTGSIPGGLFMQENLGYLNVSGNDLTGRIPAQIGDLESVSVMDLSSNNLTGPIPPEMGQLSQVVKLDLSDNSLVGTIPPEVGNLTIGNVTLLCTHDLDVSGNALRRVTELDSFETFLVENDISTEEALKDPTTPQNMAARWFANEDVYQDYCESIDPMGQDDPTEMDRHSLRAVQRYVLAVLFLSTGGFSNWNEQLDFLSTVHECDWTGVRCDGSGFDRHVTDVFLNDNGLSGALVPEICEISTMTTLQLTGNNLTGTIPPCLGDGAALQEIHLWGNNFTGKIPTELFTQRKNLTSLDLSDNGLTGTLPSEVGNLVDLTWLSLSENAIRGSLPSEVGNLVRLEFLGLFDNFFRGTLPPEIGNLVNVEFLSLSNNTFKGTLPESVGQLRSLSLLDVSRNKFNGTLPGSSLDKLNSLEHLDLSRNKFEGSVPDVFGKLMNLQFLDIGSNGFVGEVPSSLSRPGFLVRILSNTSLTGNLSFVCDRFDPESGLISADCYGDRPEVTCECCQVCCSDNEPSGNVTRGLRPKGCFQVGPLPSWI